MNLDKIYDIEIDWNGKIDHPEYTNGYISSAWIFDEEFHIDRELLDEELEQIQEENPEWVYEQIVNHLF